MSNINELTAKLKALQADMTEQVLGLKAELQTAYNAVFTDSTVVRAMVDRIESGEPDGYQWNEYGDELVQWYRMPSLSEFAEEPTREYFESYLTASACIRSIDFENDAVTCSEGGAFVINDDGDVYDTDSGKFFVSRDEYETDAERNALIEEHMERTGYFPGVFSSDRHGNVVPVDTKAVD